MARSIIGTKKTNNLVEGYVENDNIVDENIVDENVVDDNVVEEVEKRVFTDSDYVMCSSVTSGKLIVVSQSGNKYTFNGYGKNVEINYRDLVSLIRNGSDYIFEPDFIVLDEDFLDEFPTLRDMYDEMYTNKEFVEILGLPVDSMLKAIDNMSDKVKSRFMSIISTQIANGSLDSISKVRALSEYFGADFNLLSELFIR